MPVVALAVVLAGAWCCFLASAQAGCVNPSPVPSGYAAPCPVFSASAASVSQTGTLSLTATPQAGTDYIYTTAYYAQGSTWLPVTLIGNNGAPSYTTALAGGALPSSVLSTLSIGTNYVVLWDWLWNASVGCYKGPELPAASYAQLNRGLLLLLAWLAPLCLAATLLGVIDPWL